MQYWKQAAKQQQHNNDCPNSFYYSITVQLVYSHINTSSRLMAIPFPWQLVDVVMFPWKASSPLRDCSTISWKQAVGLEFLQALAIPPIQEHHFLCLSSFLQMCVQALPRLHAKIMIKLLIKLLCMWNRWRFLRLGGSNCASLRTWEGPDASSEKQQHWKKSSRFSTT